MRKRKYASRWSWVPMALGLLLFIAAAVWMVKGVQEAAAVSDREGLKAKSGLAIDEERYAVFYEIFASNMRPSVTVVERWEGEP